MTREVIIIRETTRESLIRDAGSFALASALFLPGLWLGSAALQFVGGAMFCVLIFGRAARLLRDNTMTLDQAAARIEQLRKGDAA